MNVISSLKYIRACYTELIEFIMQPFKRLQQLLAHSFLERAAFGPFQFCTGKLLHIKDTKFCPFGALNRTVQSGDSLEK